MHGRTFQRSLRNRRKAECQRRPRPRGQRRAPTSLQSWRNAWPTAGQLGLRASVCAALARSTSGLRRARAKRSWHTCPSQQPQRFPLKSAHSCEASERLRAGRGRSGGRQAVTRPLHHNCAGRVDGSLDALVRQDDAAVDADLIGDGHVLAEHCAPFHAALRREQRRWTRWSGAERTTQRRGCWEMRLQLDTSARASAPRRSATLVTFLRSQGTCGTLTHLPITEFHPMMLSATSEWAPTRVPSSSALPTTRAPASTTQPGPTTTLGPSTAVGSTVAVGCCGTGGGGGAGLRARGHRVRTSGRAARRRAEWACAGDAASAPHPARDTHVTNKARARGKRAGSQR